MGRCFPGVVPLDSDPLVLDLTRQRCVDRYAHLADAGLIEDCFDALVRCLPDVGAVADAGLVERRMHDVFAVA